MSGCPARRPSEAPSCRRPAAACTSALLLQQTCGRAATSSRIAASATGDPPARAPSGKRRTRDSECRHADEASTIHAAISDHAVNSQQSRARYANDNVPVESPNCAMSVRPSACATVSIDVGHRRPGLRLEVPVARQLSLRAAQHDQRAPLVVVDVGVAHRRAVDDQALVEQRRVAFLDRLELLQEVRQQADVVLVDQAEVGDVAVLVAVMRCRVEALG